MHLDLNGMTSQKFQISSAHRWNVETFYQHITKVLLHADVSTRGTNCWSSNPAARFQKFREPLSCCSMLLWPSESWRNSINSHIWAPVVSFHIDTFSFVSSRPLPIGTHIFPGPFGACVDTAHSQLVWLCRPINIVPAAVISINMSRYGPLGTISLFSLHLPHVLGALVGQLMPWESAQKGVITRFTHFGRSDAQDPEVGGFRPNVTAKCDSSAND